MDLDRLREIVEITVAEVERLTELRSRWNGRVELVDIVDAFGSPAFRAKKEWACGISVHAACLSDSGLVGTLVHEALHSVSAGITRPSFEAGRGFEEGVVEWLARAYAGPIAGMVGLASGPPRTVFAPYLTALDAVRRRTGVEEEQFYLTLLGTPLREREPAVVQWVCKAHPELSEIRVLAHLSGPLRTLRGNR